MKAHYTTPHTILYRVKPSRLLYVSRDPDGRVNSVDTDGDYDSEKMQLL